MMNLPITGNFVVVGETGSGKTDPMCNNTKRIFAQSDVSQLRNIYGGEGAERLAEAIRKNCNVWLPLKPHNLQGETNHEQ